MQKEHTRKFSFASAAIFILLEIAALGMLKSSSTLQNIWINRLSHSVMGFLWGGGESIRNHFSLEKQNEALAEENFNLREQLKRYKLSEAAALENDAATFGCGEFVYIPATVIKMSRGGSHNYIIVNKGSEEGVKPHNGIISANGIVGIISAVDKHMSYGMTLMNSNVSVSSRAGREGIVAPLVWDGRHSNKGVMKDIPLQYDVTPGDTIFTSGFSTIFPPDIPIGIAGSSRLVDGSSNSTEITLFQDFQALRYVTIIDNPDRSVISEIEKTEEEKQ